MYFGITKNTGNQGKKTKVFDENEEKNPLKVLSNTRQFLLLLIVKDKNAKSIEKKLNLY